MFSHMCNFRVKRGFRPWTRNRAKKIEKGIRPRNVMAARIPCALTTFWYPPSVKNLLPMPGNPVSIIIHIIRKPARLPLYRIVAKLTPTNGGNRKSSLPASQVPSPTCNVCELYVLLPGGASCGEGDILPNELPKGCWEDWFEEDTLQVQRGVIMR